MEGKHSNGLMLIPLHTHSTMVMLNVDCVECSPPGWILQEEISRGHEGRYEGL